MKVRLGDDGDTCVDNAGTGSPYVIVSSLYSNGLYRVQPGQRVMFQGGNLSAVIDQEKEPCGCPPAASETAANEFPLAQSEGLAPTPALTAPPTSAPAGTTAGTTGGTTSGTNAGTNAGATAGTNAGAPAGADAGTTSGTNVGTSAGTSSGRPGDAVKLTPPADALVYKATDHAPQTVDLPQPTAAPASTSPTTSPNTSATKPAPASKPGFFHKLGRFFRRIFGAES